jgi:transcriptional regulator with XRE-family HTH domain
MLELRMFRHRRQWTLRDLAKRSKVGVSRLCAIELEQIKPSANDRAAIAEALGVDQEPLFQPMAGSTQA